MKKREKVVLLLKVYHSTSISIFYFISVPLKSGQVKY